MSVQDVDRTKTPEVQLDILLEAVHWRPEAIDYAFVTHELGGLSDVWIGGYMHNDLPNDLTEPDIRYHRPLLTSFVPDAFGVQVLSKNHLDRASNLDAWTVDEIAPGRYLVMARELEPWLQTPAPRADNPYRLSTAPQSILAQAREDFGQMILTRQTIALLDPL